MKNGLKKRQAIRLGKGENTFEEKVKSRGNKGEETRRSRVVVSLFFFGGKGRSEGGLLLAMSGG